jgi:hypothetical protein
LTQEHNSQSRSEWVSILVAIKRGTNNVTGLLAAPGP